MFVANFVFVMPITSKKENGRFKSHVRTENYHDLV